MSKHTPGEWHVHMMRDVAHIHGHYHDERGVNHYAVADVFKHLGLRTGEFESNASLIAAAPKLLAALVDLTEPVPAANAQCHVGLMPQSECGRCQRIMKAHAAITKARGAE